MINSGEITFSPFSMMDDVGKVFFWQGRVFRAISDQKADEVLTLLESGLIKELAAKNLIPETWVTDLNFQGYNLVLEHERIPYLTYPFEWSFEMIRDAGLKILEIYKVSEKYGYTIKDCHSYNIMFNGSDSFFIDIGSFKVKAVNRVDFPFHEYVTHYIAPLLMWSGGDQYLARQALAHIYPAPMPINSWRSYGTPRWTRMRPFLFNLFNRLDRGVCGVFGRLSKKSWVPKNVLRLLSRFSSFAEINDLISLKILTQTIPVLHDETVWSRYHDQYSTSDGIQTTHRFERLLEVINLYKPATIVDLAANQGVFARLLVEKTSVDHVVCIDRDGSAIDKLYAALKASSDTSASRIQPVFSDIFSSAAIETKPSLPNRVKGEMALAFALTHHLILGQGLNSDLVFERISQFTERYVVVEFMPLGLWDGKDAPPVPKWYHFDWFKKEFEKKFFLLDVLFLEENRIAFIGQKLHFREALNNS